MIMDSQTQKPQPPQQQQKQQGEIKTMDCQRLPFQS